MVLGFSTEVLVLIAIIVFFAGTVTGITGFGYALIGTVGSAAPLDPQQAVVLMIIPVFISNIPLVRELNREQLRTCGRRFTSFIVAAAVGTVIGMAILQWIPTAMLTFALGVFTLGYVAVTQDAVSIPGKRHVTSNDSEQHANAQLGIGFGSGLIFGASNIGVSMVAYLDSLDLRRSIFVGVLALIFLGISAIRVGAAWVLDLYGTGALVWLSVGAAIVGLVGVESGQQIRHLLPDRYIDEFVLVLLSIIGMRLIVTSIGG
jgi:uncharacterized membrane protein YfcA